MGERAGRHRTASRRLQDFCHSGLPIPLSLEAGPKIIDRGSHALVPHYEAIATLARQATGGAIDATPWDCQNAWHRLWTLRPTPVSLYRLHPKRAPEALAALIEAWQGISVSDGSGV